MRPRSIEQFDKVYLASVAVSLVGMVLGWDRLGNQLGATMGNAGAGMVALSIGVGIAISLLLWFFIARKASNVAKWILVVLTAIGLFSFLSSLFLPTVPKDAQMALGGVSTLLGVYAVWLLFRPDAVAWLDSGGAHGPGDPTIVD